MADIEKFEDEYSEESFWNKLTNYAKIAGIEVIEKALLLYYAAQEEAAPAWAKATIVASHNKSCNDLAGTPAVAEANSASLTLCNCTLSG